MPDPYIQSPWPALPDDKVSKIHANISTDCLRYIKSVCPTHGLIASIIQHTFASIEHDLRAAGHACYDPTKDAEILTIIRDCTSPRTDTAANRPDVAGTTEAVCQPSTHLAHQPTNLQQTVAGGGGLGGTGGGKAKENRKQKIKIASEKFSKRLS